MIHPINGNNGPKHIAPKRNDPINQRFNPDNDSGKVRAVGADKVELSSAALERQQRTSLVKKAKIVLDKISDVRENEVLKATQLVEQDFFSSFNINVNRQVVEELIASEALGDAVQNWGIKNKLAELNAEDEQNEQHLAQIREKITTGYYDNEQRMERIVEYLIQLFTG